MFLHICIDYDLPLCFIIPVYVRKLHGARFRCAEDTYMSIDESLRGGCEYTYNGFENIDGSSRIDYVYYKGSDVTPTYYKCDNTLYDGLYPSDHWPVYADFTIGTSEIK